MAVSRAVLGAICILASLIAASGDALVPALFIFGDSIVDAGNNNKLHTIVRANFLPYGRDFVTHKPTGRFCNGKTAVDFTAENLGFTSYPPAYLSEEATGDNLLIGANFASAASGYYDETALLYGAISLPAQLEHYEEYQWKIVGMVGKENASAMFSGGIHLLSTGSSDFIQNYYINPLLHTIYTPEQFSDMLMGSFSAFVEKIYDMGARRIGVTNLPPLGCLPATITLFGHGGSKCVPKLNQAAVGFNERLNMTALELGQKLSNLTIVVFDIYQPLLDIIQKPSDNGFFEARRACCGTGTIEVAILCNSKSPGTCANATEYVFWDSFHPTEAVNQVLADALLLQGIPLLS